MYYRVFSKIFRHHGTIFVSDKIIAVLKVLKDMAMRQNYDSLSQKDGHVAIMDSMSLESLIANSFKLEMCGLCSNQGDLFDEDLRYLHIQFQQTFWDRNFTKTYRFIIGMPTMEFKLTMTDPHTSLVREMQTDAEVTSLNLWANIYFNCYSIWNLCVQRQK